MDRQEIERLLMKPTARKRLGKYVLLGRLGHGGMGKIYLAYAPGPAGIEKLLVVKRLHSHLTSDPVLVNNFLDEARLSMALGHPNIVHTYDVGEVEGRYFMVMEYIDGQNLGVVLRTAKRTGQYPDSVLWAGLFLGVLDALHAAHTARDARGRPLNIIHRDVSPQNVLVTYDGTPKLVDFGIAKAAMRISETDAGVLKGKYAYMSPEQCQSTDLDARSDIFSAGIVLWEMLAGRRLYKADSVIKSVERILHEAPISPTRANADCDPELAKVVVKALQKRPEDRFGSADEFRDALDEALHRGRHHFRQSDVRDFMSRLFSDVRERQQAILEACLSGQLEGEPDRDEVSTGRSDSSPNLNDSESVRVPDLDFHGGVEATTPSTSRRSPLITQEDEHTRRRPPPPPPPSLPDAAPADAVTDGALPDVPGRGTFATPPPAPRRGLAAAALAAVLVLGGGLVAAWLLGLFGSPAGDETLAVEGPRPSPGVQDPALATEPAPPPDPGEEEADPEPDAPSGAADRAPDDRPREVREERGRRGDRVRASSRSTNRSSARSSKASSRSREAREERPADDPTPERADKASKSEEPPKAAIAESGTLTLETVPWTAVYLGKKKLGETPIVKVPVPAGELELLLVNEGAGIRQPYFLEVEPGKAYRRKLKLD